MDFNLLLKLLFLLYVTVIIIYAYLFVYRIIISFAILLFIIHAEHVVHSAWILF